MKDISLISYLLLWFDFVNWKCAVRMGISWVIIFKQMSLKKFKVLQTCVIDSLPYSINHNILEVKIRSLQWEGKYKSLIFLEKMKLTYMTYNIYLLTHKSLNRYFRGCIFYFPLGKAYLEKHQNIWPLMYTIFFLFYDSICSNCNFLG